MRKVKTIHDHHYKALIAELAQERVRLNISQEQLAQLVGLNQSDISKIEKCDKRLDVLELSWILDALRINENLRLQKIVQDFLGMPR
ncbi:MAG: helix-turn-helix transcriptional regulator [Cyanobacteria bacterium P01_F01_bin.150]